MTTHQQLHTIEGFSDLVRDPRFVMLMSVARQQRPKPHGAEAHNLIFDSGRLDGYLDCLDRLNELLNPPVEQKDFTAPPRYTPISHPENK